MLRETGGPAPRDLGLKLGLFGGEAGLDNPELRAAMEEKWGFAVRNANFGLSEVLSILGRQTDWTTDLLCHAADVVFAEIIDQHTLARLPIEAGTTGELVCTHLRKQCQPRVRYRTRDVVTVTATDAGPDGRSARRFRVAGRTDDMFNVCGVNVFPGAVRLAVEQSAQPLMSMGLVNRVVPRDAMLDTAIALAARIAEQSPGSIARLKRLVITQLSEPLARSLELEFDATIDAFADPDAAERVKQFATRKERAQ